MRRARSQSPKQATPKPKKPKRKPSAEAMPTPIVRHGSREGGQMKYSFTFIKKNGQLPITDENISMVPMNHSTSL